MEHLVYESPKPGPGGRVSQILTPLELLDRLAALIAPPRRRRHRYFGVLAPNAALRSAVTALAAVPKPPLAEADGVAEPSAIRRTARYAWGLLLARIYEVFPLTYRKCGGAMRIIAFIDEGEAIRNILLHLGEPIAPPKLAPARGPPLWEAAGQGDADPLAQPGPEFEFDQRIAWLQRAAESARRQRSCGDAKRPTAGVSRGSGMAGQRILRGEGPIAGKLPIHDGLRVLRCFRDGG